MRLNTWPKPKPCSSLQQARWLHKQRNSLTLRLGLRQIPTCPTAGKPHRRGTLYHPPGPSQQPHAHPGC